MFLDRLKLTGAGIEKKKDGIRFYSTGVLKAVDITTGIHPGFLTDWQALWGVLMTQAMGESVIHETVFEDTLGYIEDLKRMGAKVKLFRPDVEDAERIYNFNLDDDNPKNYHAVKIKGPTQLHNAVMTTLDIRAGAAVVLAALCAKGKSTIFGIEKLDRGYEEFEKRLQELGAEIKRIHDE
jgi:UDP-N-acetylglucosamine 1-carboxyvinyltransferase